tara:strand:- start:3834 stop:3992 length:159 start_codon:yes stop_codon:yes gene_type:complete
MKIVPIKARTTVAILATWTSSGIATRTANETKIHIVPRIRGLLLFGIPFPSL